MLLVSLAVMRCLPKNGVPEKYCEANFLGEGETNEAIFKGSARKPLSLAKFVWTRGSDITTAGNITCREANITPPIENTACIKSGVFYCLSMLSMIQKSFIPQAKVLYPKEKIYTPRLKCIPQRDISYFNHQFLSS